MTFWWVKLFKNKNKSPEALTERETLRDVEICQADNSAKQRHQDAGGDRGAGEEVPSGDVHGLLPYVDGCLKNMVPSVARRPDKNAV